MKKAKIWYGTQLPKVLIIGYDPRLNKNKSEADYCFFADYYFKQDLKTVSNKAKYGLASAVFSKISGLLGKKYSIQEFVITNICNTFLPAPPKGKTAYIPPKLADEGLQEIRDILNRYQIEIIFAMSLQVNYWLQVLGFYSSNDLYQKGAEPHNIGIISNPQYYQSKDSSVFKLICGKKFIADGKYPLFPILHVKNWPLKGSFKNKYQSNYEALSKTLMEI